MSRDLFKELGVRPIINGAGSYTMMTASLMEPETIAAYSSVAGHYVRLDEWHDAIGKRIAGMLGCEAAMVTSGAAAALTVGTAACITGDDTAKMLRIPDLTGMKNEVIVQKSHRFPYDHMVRNCGVKLIEVETRDQLVNAINPQTAMLLFLNKADPKGQVKMAEFIAIARQHKIPAFNDAAADVPPVENLTKYIKAGFDLVAFSGGKGICGPQSAGLLLGRANLIRAARLQGPPNSDSIGRSCKVNKEEMAAMLVALELYLKRDHQADWREWESNIRTIAESLKKVRGVETQQFVPAIANQVPHLRVRWDAGVIAATPLEIARRLRDGEPSIELVPAAEQPGTLEIASWTMKPAEAKVVGKRLAEELQRAVSEK